MSADARDVTNYEKLVDLTEAIQDCVGHGGGCLRGGEASNAGE